VGIGRQINPRIPPGDGPVASPAPADGCRLEDRRPSLQVTSPDGDERQRVKVDL
jgi:hypothetical protein